MNTTSRPVRWGFSIIAVAAIYLNCAVIWKPLAARLAMPALPVSLKLDGAIHIFGVFSTYETNNQELVVWGYTGDPAVGTRGWKPLITEEYFPFKRGEQQSRLWANKLNRTRGPGRLWQAWVRYGDQILARHNRLHPDAPVSQVGIENRTWPRSPQGFYSLLKPTNLETNFSVVATNR